MPNLSDDPIGRCLGEYRIEVALGSGGQGSVYAATHLPSGRPCAVKVLRADRAGSSILRRRLLREARLLAQLDHPNLIRFREVVTLEGGMVLVATDRIAGEPFHARLMKNGRVPLLELLPILRDAAVGLAEAHRVGVLHRDVSPDNLMLVPQPGGGSRAVVIDFGLARPTDGGESSALTAIGAVVGKIPYVCPEMARGLPPGEALDGRADVYALGVVAYRAATGVFPFAGGTPREILRMHQHEQPPPMARAAPQLSFPEDFEALVLRMLVKDRSQRPWMPEVGAAFARLAAAL